MDRIQTQAPKTGETFTRFFVPAGSDVNEAAGRLGPIMDTAARRQRRMGVLGPDAELDAEVTLAALKSRSNGKLKGMTLVYLGPGEHRLAVESAANASGSRFIFVKYP